MPKYLIETDVVIGCYCFGGAEIESGHAYLKLTDKELSAIKNLVQKTGTYDIEEMNLAKVHPEIYNKIEEAYCEAAINAAKWYWNTDAWSKRDNDYYGVEYDYDYAVNLAKYYLGYEPNKSKVTTKRGEKEYFEEWLNDQIFFHRSEKTEQLLEDLFQSEPEYAELDGKIKFPAPLLKDMEI